MSVKYKFKNPVGLYFVSFATKDWVDVFTRNEYKLLLCENLRYCQDNKGLEIYAWCIMTNHLHLIIGAKDGFLLPNIMRDFKKHTSKLFLQTIASNKHESRREWMLNIFKLSKDSFRYQFWQHDNHPIEVWSEEVIIQKLNYLHNNPVAERYVDKAEDYVYSSARDYHSDRQCGLIKINFITI